jgi:hypothetical protein
VRLARTARLGADQASDQYRDGTPRRPFLSPLLELQDLVGQGPHRRYAPFEQSEFCAIEAGDLPLACIPLGRLGSAVSGFERIAGAAGIEDCAG